MAMLARNRLIGGTYHIFLAYFSGLNFREYPSKIWPYMVQYLHFRILKWPLISGNMIRIHMAKNMVRWRTSMYWILKISHWWNHGFCRGFYHEIHEDHGVTTDSIRVVVETTVEIHVLFGRTSAVWYENPWFYIYVFIVCGVNMCHFFLNVELYSGWWSPILYQTCCGCWSEPNQQFTHDVPISWLSRFMNHCWHDLIIVELWEHYIVVIVDECWDMDYYKLLLIIHLFLSK